MRHNKFGQRRAERAAVRQAEKLPPVSLRCRGKVPHRQESGVIKFSACRALRLPDHIYCADHLYLEER